MEAWVWPVEFRSKASPRVLLGRLFHWALVALAIGVIAGGVIASSLVLSGDDAPLGLVAIDAGQMVSFVSFCGISLFFLGRSLRYVIARE